MKLSLVIPNYNTDEELVNRLFSTINNQKNFDFNELEIWFVDDCSTKKYNYDNFAQFDNLAEEKINIVELKENGGPGVARQCGLNHANGDYVIFADSDDRFMLTHKESKDGKEIEYGVFEYFLKLIEVHNKDIIRTSWIEEQKKDKRIICLPHLAQLDNTWLHGKLFKRQFLKDKAIAFHPKLRKQEDTYFNSLAAELGEAVAYNGLLSYVWCDENKQSLTRSNNCLYSYNAMVDFVDAIDYAVSTLNKRKGDDINIIDKILANILYIYFILQTPSWRDKTKRKYNRELRQRIGQFINKYKDVWNYVKTTDKHFMDLYIDRYNTQYEQEKFIPFETFNNFLRKVQI